MTEGTPAPRLVLPRTITGREPQYLLLTLLGDYWSGRPELLPSAALAGVLEEFGIAEGNARQAMRRLAQRELLAQEKVGRSTFYGVPERLRRRSPERVRRALTFGTGFNDWDGQWTVVAFTVPERIRAKRQSLRTRLKSLHMACLQDTLWVSPRDRVERVRGVLEEIGVLEATVMRARIDVPDGTGRSWAEVFDLAELARGYQEFIDIWAPVAAQILAGNEPSEGALVTRTKLLSDWLAFRLEDPDLPVQLLPDVWPRAAARTLALSIYDGLGASASEQFRTILARYDAALAARVTYHTSAQYSSTR